MGPYTFFNHYAGRCGAQSSYSIIEGKNGAFFEQLEADGTKRKVINFGLACSEAFGDGKQLLKITKPSRLLEARVVSQWENGETAETLSVHTSAGVTNALKDFIEELGKHVFWNDSENDDWFVNLQMEGASAVWAAVEILLQLRYADNSSFPLDSEWKVAVAELSYHGSATSSMGAHVLSKPPFGMHHRQISYPVPSSLTKREGESERDLNERAKREFDRFLEIHAGVIQVLLIEPQRGSSGCGEIWETEVLRYYIDRSKEYGISVCVDEIMCGLGRHGKGNIFLSKSLGLNADAVTFGKAIAGGCGDVLSGVLVKSGARKLAITNRTSFQSHTYACASAKALLTASQVLKEIPLWYGAIRNIHSICHEYFAVHFEKIDAVKVCGQGAMWGLMFVQKSKEERMRSYQTFKEISNCLNVKPYYVDRTTGFMVTPVYDIDLEILKEGCLRLQSAVERSLVKPDESIPLVALEEEAKIA